MSAQYMSESEPVFPRLGGGITWAGRQISYLLGVLELAIQIRRERRMPGESGEGF